MARLRRWHSRSVAQQLPTSVVVVDGNSPMRFNRLDRRVLVEDLTRSLQFVSEYMLWLQTRAATTHIHTHTCVINSSQQLVRPPVYQQLTCVGYVAAVCSAHTVGTTVRPQAGCHWRICVAVYVCLCVCVPGAGAVRLQHLPNAFDNGHVERCWCQGPRCGFMLQEL